jgi:hypothetical protein
MERVPFELIKDNVKLIVADGDLTGRAPSGYKPPGSGGGNQPNEQGEQKGGTDTDMGKNNNNNNNKNKNKNANLNRMIHHDSLRDSSTVLRNSTGKGNIEFLKIGSSVVEKSDLIQIIPQHQFIQYHGQSSPMLSESGLFKNISDQSNSQIAFHGIPKKLKNKINWVSPANWIFHQNFADKSYKTRHKVWNSIPKKSVGSSTNFDHLTNSSTNETTQYSFDHLPMIPVGPHDLNQFDRDAKIHVLPNTLDPTIKTLPGTASGQFRRNIIEELDRFLLIKQMIKNGIHNFRVRLPYYDLRKKSNRVRIKEELILWKKMNLRLRDKNYPDLGGISRWWIVLACVASFATAVHIYHYKYVEYDMVTKEEWRQKLVQRHIISEEVLEHSTKIAQDIQRQNFLDPKSTTMGINKPGILSDATVKRQTEEDIYVGDLTRGDIEIAQLTQDSAQLKTLQKEHNSHSTPHAIDLKSHFRNLELPVLPASSPIQAVSTGPQITIMSEFGQSASVTYLPTKINQPNVADILASIDGDIDGDNKSAKNIKKSVFNTIQHGHVTKTPQQPASMVRDHHDDHGLFASDDIELQINALLAQQERELQLFKNQESLQTKQSYTSSSLVKRGYSGKYAQELALDTNNDINSNITAGAGVQLPQRSGQIVPTTHQNVLPKRAVSQSVLNHVLDITPRSDGAIGNAVGGSLQPIASQSTPTITPPLETTPTSTTQSDQPTQSLQHTNHITKHSTQHLPQEQSYLMQAGDFLYKTAQSTGGAAVAGVALAIIAPYSIPVQLGIIGGGYGLFGVASHMMGLFSPVMTNTEPVDALIAVQDQVANGKTTLGGGVKNVENVEKIQIESQSQSGEKTEKIDQNAKVTPKIENIPEKVEIDPLAEFQKLVDQHRENERLDELRKQNTNTTSNIISSMSEKSGLHAPVRKDRPKIEANTFQNLETKIAFDDFDRQLADMQGKNPLSFTKETTLGTTGRVNNNLAHLNDFEQNVIDLENRQKILQRNRTSPEFYATADDDYEDEAEFIEENGITDDKNGFKGGDKGIVNSM